MHVCYFARGGHSIMNMAKFVLSGFLMYLYMRKRAASVYRICFPWNY